ncbi:MAG: hypothetical protein PVJ40_05735 [Gammaproteobacteria bacterium]|jgi:phosphoglycolate phosphatase-like HAD superfamily hydrolase
MNVLLDLDGKLTDPRRGFVACLYHALTALGRTPPPEEAIAAHIGPPLEETLDKLASRLRTWCRANPDETLFVAAGHIAAVYTKWP